MSTFLLQILESRVSLIFFRLSARSSHFKSWSIFVTLADWLKSDLAHLAALCWTISSLRMSSLKTGFHMDAIYSIPLWTNEVYAKHLDVMGLPLRLRRMKPSFLLALCAVLSTWGYQERSLDNSTPRCAHLLQDLAVQGVEMLQRCFRSWPGSQDVAFWWVEWHSPRDALVL